MARARIKFLLVQIDEAHSTAWPVGLPETPAPQRSFDERVQRANHFVRSHGPQDPFIVKVDGWDNDFAETFRVWPDKYYLVDSTLTVLAKSEYGNSGEQDALIKVDCTELICDLL